MVNKGKVMEEAKAKALQAALAQIEKQFGKGSIMKMDSAAARGRKTAESTPIRNPSWSPCCCT